MASKGQKLPADKLPPAPGQASRNRNGFEVDPSRAVKAGKKGMAVRWGREALRQKMLELAVKNGLDKHFAKAVKAGDIDGIEFCEKAMRLVGIDYQSSPEYRQTTVKADVKSEGKVDHTLNITFSDAPAKG